LGAVVVGLGFVVVGFGWVVVGWTVVVVVVGATVVVVVVGAVVVVVVVGATVVVGWAVGAAFWAAVPVPHAASAATSAAPSKACRMRMTAPRLPTAKSPAL
jgi:hypothetical protein